MVINIQGDIHGRDKMKIITFIKQINNVDTFQHYAIIHSVIANRNHYYLCPIMTFEERKQKI